MNVDPIAAIEKNILRKDLFYRLSGNMLYLLPLRERKDDIEYLIDKYIDYFNGVYDKHVTGISEKLREFFLTYDWEGNVRELKHVIESMVSMSREEVLQFSQIPIYLHSKLKGVKGFEGEKRKLEKDEDDNIVVDFGNEDYDLRRAVEQVERSLILKILDKTRGNKTKAGELLGIPRQTLKYKMDKLGISDKE